jgi:16S rRNA (cytidine1402-2'-O)-methyltransferase
MSFFYVVATPIGNLKDITIRALDILKEVDFILCEDTRVTKKLLDHYNINKELISYHIHSLESKIEYITSLLKKGFDLALLCDAGTPGISDPGNELINKIVDKLGDKVSIIPLPGPSSLTAAISICGFNMQNFVFMGFPPTKRKRGKFFKEVALQEYPVVFFESSHRILKSLKELSESMVKYAFKKANKRIVVCRELTKKFESIYRGEINEVLELLEKDNIKGEFVIVLSSFLKG